MDDEVLKYQQELKDSLPEYAFAYEDGEKYIRTEHMVIIERKVAEFERDLYKKRYNAVITAQLARNTQ